MRYLIKYFCIDNGANLFALPDFDYEEVVEASSPNVLRKYIESQKDSYGNPYKKRKGKRFGFDYTSRRGGVKVVAFNSPKVKKLG